MNYYSPEDISVIVGGSPITGFADGTFVAVERNEDAFTLTVGADGEGTRTRSANKSGKVTITLTQTSASNGVLNDFASMDEQAGNGTFALQVKNGQGNVLYSAATAWVTKRPNAEFGKELGQREWVIETDKLEMDKVK